MNTLLVAKFANGTGSIIRFRETVSAKPLSEVVTEAEYLRVGFAYSNLD